MSANTKPSDNFMSRKRNGRGNGRFLWFIWAGWVVVLLLVVGMFAASLPFAVFEVKYFEWQVAQARPVAVNIFSDFDAFVTYLLVLRLTAVTVFWATAVYIVWRKPQEWMVIYVSATLLMMSYLFAFQTDVNRWRFPHQLLEHIPAIEWIAPSAFTICFFLLFYLFPDGRFLPKWIGVLGIAVTGVSILFFSQLENVLGMSEETAWVLFGMSVLMFAIIGLFSQMLKWRRATFVQKQQTRLVLFALGAFISLPLLQSLLGLFIGDNAWLHFFSLHLFLFGATLIPITIGISALRFRLWQMEVLLNRTLVYGILTIVILTIYVLFVGGISTLFQTNVSLLAAALATGLVALLVHPLRVRLQKIINQFMFGQRDDPFTIMSTLGKQLENTAVPGETLPTLVITVAQALKLPYTAIVNEAQETIAATGDENVVPQKAFSLVYQSQPVGQLVVAQRTAKEPFTTDETRLLRNVARQAGTAVYATQLTTQLQRSREQLVTAREEERRRLRRDLHDGLGPQLATLTIKASAAQNILRTNPEQAEQLLNEIKAESQLAIKEIRHVVEGLRPSALDQLGLLSALSEFVAQNGNGRTHIAIHAPEELPMLPAAVEVAAYRILIEAITNTLRHAQAQTCHIQLTINGTMTLQVQDDGCGLPANVPYGVGLYSMQERAEELGGTFAIQSQPGQGTTIQAILPITENP